MRAHAGNDAALAFLHLPPAHPPPPGAAWITTLPNEGGWSADARDAATLGWRNAVLFSLKAGNTIVLPALLACLSLPVLRGAGQARAIVSAVKGFQGLGFQGSGLCPPPTLGARRRTSRAALARWPSTSFK